MGRPYSMDLRERVIAAVEEELLTYEEAAERFGIGISTVKRWLRRVRDTGSVAPGQMGGHKPRKIAGDHHDWLMERCAEAAFTLRGLVAELAGRGLKVDYRSVRQFVLDQKLRFKKRHMLPPNKIVPTSSGGEGNGGNASP